MRKILLVVATGTAFALASCGGSNSGTIQPPPPPPTVTVAVSPSPASVEVFETQQFTAMITGSSNTAVTWQVNGVAGGSATTGTITPGGLYTAPHSVPVKSVSGASQTTTVTVTAIAAANAATSGSSTVTVNPPPGVQTLQTTPIALGSSGGNVLDKVTNGNTITCCGGTLGSLVTRGGTQFILSNNHVLARSDAGSKTAGATLGDGISQPALVDSRCGQNPTTTVANLTDFFNLEMGTQATNIDAAIAQVVNGMVDTSGNILELGSTATNGVPNPGPPSSTVANPTMGLAVAKSGRSTGLTCSTVTGINVTTTSVSYSKMCGGTQSFTAGYSGLVMVGGGDFSAGGDSGSLIVSQANAQPVALLFAGSDTDTVGNPISEVLNFFSTAGNPMTVVGGANHTVIGCTGPFPLAVKGAVPNSLAGQVSTASNEKMQRAMAVRDAHQAELMAYPEAQAIGVGASYDNAEEPAILFFVTRGAARTGIPAEVEGVRTRIIQGDLFAARGVLTQAESAQLEQSAGAPQMAYGLPDSEVKRALGVQSAHQDEWLQKAGVQAVGVTSSVDSPGESALLIYLVRGEAHDPIPAVIDGLRTRVRVGSRFKAGVGGGVANASCKVAAATATVSPEKKATRQGRD